MEQIRQALSPEAIAAMKRAEVERAGRRRPEHARIQRQHAEDVAWNRKARRRAAAEARAIRPAGILIIG